MVEIVANSPEIAGTERLYMDWIPTGDQLDSNCKVNDINIATGRTYGFFTFYF